MELNVIKKSAANATPEVLVRAVKRAQAILARLIATETYLDGATAFTSPDRSLLASANHAADLRLPPGVSATKVLDTIDAHFTAMSSRCASLDASELEWPGELKAAIESRGWRAVKRHVHLLSNYAPPAVDLGVQVIPGRAAYGELRQALADRAAKQHDDPATAKQQADAAMDQLDDSRIDIFLARQSRKPVGTASLLTLGNVGVVLDLFESSANDSSVVFTTLAARLLDHCLRAQFEQVILCQDEGDPQRPRFAALGFKPVANYLCYVRADL